MILFLFLFVVVAWLTWWTVKICAYLIFGMLVVGAAVVQGFVYALSTPRVAQGIERRVTYPEAGGSIPPPRSEDSFPTWPYLEEGP